MNDRPMYTRREFLQTSLVMLSAASLVPMFVQRSALAAGEPLRDSATSSLAGVPQDRVLVVVQLGGGNDGLNTIVPFGDAEYYRARPMLGIRDKDVLKLNDSQGIGLNPDMVDLKAMYDEGLASIIQGVGYPNPNRSHFVSMDIWHTADTSGGKGRGWIGKAMDQVIANNPKVQSESQGGPIISLGGESPLATQGRRVQAVSVGRPEMFRWAGADLHETLATEYQKLNQAPNLTPEKITADPLAFITRTAMDAQVASERIRAAVNQAPVTSFPAGPLANQLRMVAAMIRAGLPARVYYTSMGGFDTHAQQPNSHGRNLREFASAVRAFYKELAAMGQQNRVLTMGFSEFGRRVQQNASMGTDHGTAGPLFMFGPMIRPGLIGEHPSLTNLDKGDLIHNVDFRSVYATVLEQWLKIDSSTVLGQRFQPAMVLDPKKLT